MLSDWYFCSCVGLNPAQTSAVLTMMNVIRHTDNNRLLYLTYSELILSNAWIQLYALPLVLDRQNASHGRTNPAMRDYFNDMLARIPNELQQKLITELYATRNRKEIEFVQHFEHIAETLVAQSSERNPSVTPYLDLESFLPEAMFIAYLHSNLTNTRFAERFVDSMAEGKVIAVQRFLEAAQKNQFGRLVLRLALRVNARLRPGFKDNAIYNVLWSLKDAAPDIEPDLLQTLLNVQFIDHSNSDYTNNSCAARMFSEAETLQMHRAFLYAGPPDNQANAVTVMLRLGLHTRNETDVNALSLVIWQSLLWQSAAAVAPRFSAEQFRSIWDFPNETQASVILLMDTQSTSMLNIFFAWRDQLNVLAKLHNAFVSIRFDHHEYHEKVTGESRWLFFSPWLPLGKSSFKYNGTRYVGAENHVLLIRLLSAAFVATRLVPHLQQGEYRDHCVLLVMHAKNVIDHNYGRWLSSYGKAQIDQRPLSLRLTGMMIYCNDEIKRLAENPLLPPEVFLTPRRQYVKSNDRNFNIHLAGLLEVAIPEVLFSIIADIYNNASGSVGAARWLPLIHEIYDYLRRAGNRASPHKRQLGALVYRFLFPHPSALDLSKFDWQAHTRKKEGKIHARQLLLTQTLDAATWLEFEPLFIEAEAEQARKAEVEQAHSLTLIRTIEQLGALENDKSLTHKEKEALKNRWMDDWRMSMAAIHHRYDLDRFARLRLLELLDSSLLADSPDDQRIIAYLLLEFGSIYEIDQLVRRVFWNISDHQTIHNTRLEPVNYSRRQVRIAILQYVVRRIEYLDLSDDEKDIRTPFTIQRRLEKESYMRSFVRRVALVATQMADKDVAYDLLNELKSLYRELLGNQMNTPERVVEAEIRRISYSEKLYAIQNSVTPIEDWQITRASVDPNHETVILHYHDIDTRNIRNFFRYTDDELQRFLHNKEQGPLTVVARLLRRHSQSHGKSFTYEFHVGLPDPIRGSFAHPINGRAHFFELQIQRTDRGYWEATDILPRPFYPQRRIGDLTLGPKIIEYYDANSNIRRFKYNAPYKAGQYYDERMWDADISRRFAPFFHDSPSLSAESEAYVADINIYRGKEQEVHYPREISFEELLIAKEAFGVGQEQVYVLTLLEIHEPDPITGNSSWLFAVRPGFNVLLHDEDFTRDLLETIEAAVEIMGNPAGLLVVVQPQVQGDGQVCFIAAPSLPNDERLALLFPNLEYPLDQRNWRWCYLFNMDDNDSTPVAVFDPESYNWYYRIPPEVGLPSSFPDRLIVDFGDSQPPENSAECEMQFPIWRNWMKYVRLFTVEASAPPQYSIEPSGSDDDFFARWYTMDQGRRIEIGRVIGKIQPDSVGNVLCLTVEGLGVFVQADSLTLDIIKLSERLPDPDNPRAAVITSASNWQYIGGVEITEDSIPPHVDGNYHGVLLSMPVNVKSLQRCEVLWQTKHGTQRSAINITNLTALGTIFRPGCQIDGILKDSRPQLRAASRMIFCQALWKHPQPFALIRTPHQMLYLGQMNFSDCLHHIASCFAGELVILPEDFPGAPHLAHISLVDDQWQIENGLKPNSPVQYRKPRIGYVDPFSSKSRVVILTDNESAIVGFSDHPISGTRLRLDAITCQLAERNDGFVTIQRTVQVTSVDPERRWSPTAKSELSDRIDRTDEHKAALENYMAAPEDLEARIHGQSAMLQALRVPENIDRLTWSFRVPLYDSETYIIGNNYATEGLVRLLELADGRIVASTRAASPYNVRRYYNEMGAPLKRNIPLDEYLYYVGSEEMDSSINIGQNAFDLVTNDATQNGGSVVGHRFEWGYGKTLLVPENHLRFDGMPFQSGQLLLFYGDYITEVEFIAEEQPHATTAADDIDSTIYLNIQNYNLSWSEGRRLFMQRRDFRMIHLVHLINTEGSLRVQHVEAFNEENIRQNQIEFSRVRGIARLSSDSAALLSQRSSTGDGGRELVINGRLKEDVYIDTAGRVVEFEHVYLGFEEGQGATPLYNGELVFLDGQEIELLENDQCLKLAAPTVLDTKDVSRVLFRRLIILRRQFSVREEILRRIYDEDPNYIKRRLLVRLTQRDDARVNASMVNNLPPRKPRAVVSDGRQMVILALWIRKMGGEQPDKVAIELELRPGVTVRLENNRECTIDSYPSEIERGAVVRVEIVSYQRNNIRLRIVLASFSDNHYVPDDGRPVVALPKNSLLNRHGNDDSEGKSDAFWNNLFGFTIGGLPNIVAAPGFYDQLRQSWYPPRANDFMTLMQTPHPKIVYLRRDGKPYRVTCNIDDSIVGYLYNDEGNKITLCTYSNRGNSMLNTHLFWRYQTFAHESSRAVMERARRETWSYHDAESGYWLDDQTQTVFEEIDKHDGFSGPLFFQSIDCKVPKLRYDEHRLLTFGFPVNELVAHMTSHGRRTTLNCTVVAASKDGGVWVELAPGRVYEIPKEIIVWKMTRWEISLANFAWSLFAPGDRLVVQLVHGNVLEIDRIGFRNWYPGPRAAFGNQQVILPTISYDSDAGALELGSGDYTLMLPVERFDPDDAVVLHPDNYIARVVNVRRGDVVLLGLDTTDTVIVLGLPGWSAQADLKQDWSQDPFNLVTYRDGQSIRELESLRQTVKAVGGALPVMVEVVLEQHNLIYFSRRWEQQAESIKPSEVALVRVVGTLNSGRKAVLRVGGGLLCLPMAQFVSGLPEEYFSYASEFLIRSQYNLWLRRDEYSNFHVGLTEEAQSREFFVRGCGLLTDDDGQPLGLLCSSTASLCLYWLPVQWLSWTSLTATQIKELFTNTPDAFLVTRYQNSAISLRHLEQARQLHKRLRIGDALQVRVLTPIEDEHSTDYFVQIGPSRLLARCETHSGNLDREMDVAVEVIKCTNQSGRPDVCVVPLGERRYHLDLPGWMLNTEQMAADKCMEQYNEWQATAPEQSTFDIDELNAGTYDTDIDKLLCYAYTYFSTEKPNAEFQIQVAIRWHWLRLKAPEMDVALTIMAIIILFEYGIHYRDSEVMQAAFPHCDDNEMRVFQRHWRNKATELLISLGRRALRSLHVELLANQYRRLRDEGTIYTDTLSERLNYVFSLLKPELDRDELRFIHQFYRVTQFRSTSLRITGKSCAAAIGLDPGFTSSEIESAIVIKNLTELYNSIQTIAPSYIRLQKHIHIKDLKDLLRNMEYGNVANVHLLAELPTIDNSEKKTADSY